MYLNQGIIGIQLRALAAHIHSFTYEQFEILNSG